MLWLGIQETSKILLIALGVAFAAASGGEIVLEVGIPGKGLPGSQWRASKIGVQDHARSIDHRAKRRRKRPFHSGVDFVFKRRRIDGLSRIALAGFFREFGTQFGKHLADHRNYQRPPVFCG